MVVQSKKHDYEFSPSLFKARPFELWANVDSLGRKLIWVDDTYKIAVDSYSNPSLLRLFTKATIGERKVGELICIKKEYFGKTYITLKYLTVEKKHNGAGYSYKMMNCLLSILPNTIEGIITNYNDRQDPRSMKTMFTNLGGYINKFGYLEIKNPKLAPFSMK